MALEPSKAIIYLTIYGWHIHKGQQLLLISGIDIQQTPAGSIVGDRTSRKAAASFGDRQPDSGLAEQPFGLGYFALEGRYRGPKQGNPTGYMRGSHRSAGHLTIKTALNTGNNIHRRSGFRTGEPPAITGPRLELE